jgi:5-amino-6-(5-phosphoribosylamino)uracil reductase
VARGLPPNPVKVTLSSSGDLDPAAAFFTAGEAVRLVYVPDSAVAAATGRVGAVATVVGAGDPLDLHALLADLAARGIGRLMVEGGAQVHTLFLAEDVVDEVRLAVAPLFVGDPGAPRLLGPGTRRERMRLVDLRQLGDTAVLRYLVR